MFIIPQYFPRVQCNIETGIHNPDLLFLGRRARTVGNISRRYSTRIVAKGCRALLSVPLLGKGFSNISRNKGANLGRRISSERRTPVLSIVVQYVKFPFLVYTVDTEGIVRAARLRLSASGGGARADASAVDEGGRSKSYKITTNRSSQSGSRRYHSALWSSTTTSGHLSFISPARSSDGSFTP